MKSLNLKLWMLGITSALLLSIPYIIPHTGLVMLVAFIPLFTAEYIAALNKKKNFWIIYYCAFFIWNILTTYWVFKATPAGAVAAIILNALQMSIIFRLFRWFRKIATGIFPYIIFMLMWVGWEHIYYDVQVSWPWLTLGNAFATSVKSIQWYAMTGTLGGSVWILLMNILFFRIIKFIVWKEEIFQSSIVAAIFLFVPLIYSQFRYYTYKENSGYEVTKEVAILQPNIDPYNDKFSGLSNNQQDTILFNIAKEAVTPNTFLVLAPETFFSPDSKTNVLLENTPDSNTTYKAFKSFAMSHKVNFIWGAVTQFFYAPKDQNGLSSMNGEPGNDSPSPTAINFAGALWYDTYNTAVFNNPNGLCDFYHKSKLVIMAETYPIFRGKVVLQKLGIDLGGGYGSFAKQSERTVFTTSDGTKIGTAICYESVYGDFYRGYINKGAELMSVITNDGWWGNTFGYRQHLNYARLRAIETRRDIARCANTGISAIINQRGDIKAQTSWWQKGYLRGDINSNHFITPFVNYGDVTGIISVWATLLFILLGIVHAIRKRDLISGII
jgi:apolipoprotein N-acyltransferase